VTVAAVTSTLHGTPASSAAPASTSATPLTVRGPPHPSPHDIPGRFPSIIPRAAASRSDAPCLRECKALYCDPNVHPLKTLKPAWPAANALQARHGTCVTCVRRPYDEATRERVEAVELLVQSRSRRAATVPPATQGLPPHRVVGDRLFASSRPREVA